MEGDRYTRVCDLGNEKKNYCTPFPSGIPEILRDIQRSSEIFSIPLRLSLVLPGFLFLYKPLRPSIAINAYRSSPRGEQY